MGLKCYKIKAPTFYEHMYHDDFVINTVFVLQSAFYIILQYAHIIGHNHSSSYLGNNDDSSYKCGVLKSTIPICILSLYVTNGNAHLLQYALTRISRTRDPIIWAVCETCGLYQFVIHIVMLYSDTKTICPSPSPLAQRLQLFTSYQVHYRGRMSSWRPWNFPGN